MPPELTVDRYLDGLRDAMIALVRFADRAGMSAGVPTCPEWTVRELVAHQGMVHRWAAAHVRGESTDEPRTWEVEGQSVPDPLEWLRDGVVDLAQAIVHAPDDLDTKVFLADAPSPKVFWARRQCHETTIHAVDALAASMGRMPKDSEVDWVDDELALDGLDEYLCGFVPRRSSALQTPRETSYVVSPDDSSSWWHLALSDAAPVTTRRDGPVDGASDWELNGPAVELYLRLWNRADPPVPNPREGDGTGLTSVKWTR